MTLNHKTGFLIYTVALMVLTFIDFLIQLDDLFKDTDSLMLVGTFIYLLSAISIARGKWKYFGLISGSMVWTGLFCVPTSLVSIFDPETSTYDTTFNILYAFFAVFGGMRIYSAWLQYTRSQEEQS